jgi:hypothetical protein
MKISDGRELYYDIPLFLGRQPNITVCLVGVGLAMVFRLIPFCSVA